MDIERVWEKLTDRIKIMEIPRIWREQPTRVRFEGSKKELKGTGVRVYKYPGGEIPLSGSYEQIREKFERKGFAPEVVDEILFRLWGGISAEAPVSLAEVADSFFKFAGSEVRK